MTKKFNVHEGPLVLVSAQHPIKSQGFADWLCQVASGIRMEQTAGSQLLNLLSALNGANEIVLTSGYRGNAEQQALYANSLLENGEAFTKSFVALPGCSEHETGLAIDLGLRQDEMDFLCPSFPFEGLCLAFRKLMPQYGFIQRYPEGKRAITGIAPEPWHFRYVGYPHSAIMAQQDMTLEEYVDWIRAFKGPENAYMYAQGARTVAVFFLSGADIETDHPDGSLTQYSGNNVDGFIVTRWRS